MKLKYTNKILATIRLEMTRDAPEHPNVAIMGIWLGWGLSVAEKGGRVPRK